MEITSPLAEPEGRGAVRKLFMKLGEKVGTIKISELSPDYLNRVKDADAYKVQNFYMINVTIFLQCIQQQLQFLFFINCIN